MGNERRNSSRKRFGVVVDDWVLRIPFKGRRFWGTDSIGGHGFISPDVCLIPREDRDLNRLVD